MDRAGGRGVNLRRSAAPAAAAAIGALLIFAAEAQFPGGPPRLRQHTVTQSKGAVLLPADRQPSYSNRVSITTEGDRRVIRANGIPDHLVGAFPNRGNPNAIAQQERTYQVPLTPVRADSVTKIALGVFGVAVNGVPFDLGANEFYQGQRGPWQYEALSGAVALGIDANYAHVQPTGTYHYHGLPLGLMAKLGLRDGMHSPLIGWAGDGYPIYALYGYVDGRGGGIGEMRPSFRLKQGTRPVDGGGPGGRYDGTFTADYEYVPGTGDLDECNGRQTVTPEFPNGTYAYFLTRAWPVVSRCFTGVPDDSFRHRQGGQGSGMGDGQRMGPGGMGGPGGGFGGPPPGGRFGPPPGDGFHPPPPWGR
jgi:hypothetical protein